ncbi:MAG: NAD+ synthase [Candidatus Krumholzibacteriota bacterium]|nr:NAD+ synthase [Candidatus Krumholzibacteriota bacterium]
MRIGLAQVNPTVGDLAGNVGLVGRLVAEAKRAGVQLLAFPELVICGYPPEDLLLKPRFLADCEAALAQAASLARGIALVVGAPEKPDHRGGHPYNTAVLLYRGRIAARYRKIHLPNYGVFDEQRYFSAGEAPLAVDLGGLRVGLSVCEDVWVDRGPVEALASDAETGVVVNISASPYHRRKGPERERLMRRRAKENGIWLFYVNLLGGQDELVFDGSSVIADPAGRTVARGRPFREDLIVADVPVPARPAAPRGRRPRAAARPAIVRLPALYRPARRPPLRRRRTGHLAPVAEVYEALVLGTRDYVDKNGFSHVVLGISGGLDSALTAAIAVDALGRDRVTGVTMPSGYTSEETLADARRLAASLRIELLELPIGPAHDAYRGILGDAGIAARLDVTEENIQARIRGNLLMALSNARGWLVLTTGNKSETAVGYCTLYGDMAGGFAVLKDVPKTLAWALARDRNRRARQETIPRSIIRRPPSAELRPGQCDQDSLPAYRILDRVIELYVEHDLSVDEIVARGIEPATARRTVDLIDRNEYKRRQAPPGIKITPKAFGRDRRLPITNRYRDRGRRSGPTGP